MKALFLLAVIGVAGFYLVETHDIGASVDVKTHYADNKYSVVKQKSKPVAQHLHIKCQVVAGKYTCE